MGDLIYRYFYHLGYTGMAFSGTNMSLNITEGERVRRVQASLIEHGAEIPKTIGGSYKFERDNLCLTLERNVHGLKLLLEGTDRDKLVSLAQSFGLPFFHR